VANALNDEGDVVEFKRKEPDLVAFLDASKTGVWGCSEAMKAQRLVDIIDLVRQFEEHYLRYLTTCSDS